MIWCMLAFAVIGVIAYKCIQKKRGEEEAESTANERARSSTSSGSAPTPAVSRASHTETIEDQHLSQCLPRFCGAIDAIRKENTWRDNSQGGSYGICREEDGTYSLYGFYDHDADSGVMHALSFYGYLKYMGIEYQEDGFRYQLNGFRDEYGEPYLSESWVVDYIRNYFGSDVSIVVNSVREGGISISFRFPA